jgi:ribosomal protein S18 acetylase RimI-like enzyme
MIEIKKANKRDFRNIAEIYMEEFSKKPYNEPWTMKKALKKLDVFSRYCDIYKILSDRKIVGFMILNSYAYCPGEVIYGEEFGIKSEFQNKGIGTICQKKIEDIYKKKKYKIFQMAASKNASAYKLYLKMGFKRSLGGVLLEKKLK